MARTAQHRESAVAASDEVGHRPDEPLALDTPAKRAAAERYLNTLSEMNPDAVLRDRIERMRRRLART